MDFKAVSLMGEDQLRELAGKMNVQIHHKAGKDKLFQAIMDAALNPQMQTPKHDPMQNPAEAAVAPVHDNKPEDVEKAIASIKARVPEFQSIYNDEENTWHFRCKGAEECGNLAIPLRVIKMKADNVSVGRRALRALNKEFGDIANSPRNEYTNTVLS